MGDFIAGGSALGHEALVGDERTSIFQSYLQALEVGTGQVGEGAPRINEKPIDTSEVSFGMNNILAHPNVSHSLQTIQISARVEPYLDGGFSLLVQILFGLADNELSSVFGQAQTKHQFFSSHDRMLFIEQVKQFSLSLWSQPKDSICLLGEEEIGFSGGAAKGSFY